MNPQIQDFPDSEIKLKNLSSPGNWSYHWDFGDGQSSEEAYPSHTYNKSGDYAVTLTVANTNGDSDDVTHVMVVEDPV